MKFPSSTHHSLKKKIFYVGFMLSAGSLLVSYRHSTYHRFYRPKGDGRPKDLRGSVSLIDQWKVVLEGMEERKSWENVTSVRGNATLGPFRIPSSISLSGEAVKTNFDYNTSQTQTKNGDQEQRKPAGRTKCKTDLSTRGNMAAFQTRPILDFSPTYNETVTDYYVTVAYDVIFVQVKGHAVDCQAEVRLTDRHGPSGLTNYTIGVGLNRVQLHVVDLMHSEPWIINTYTLNIYRQPPGEPLAKFDVKVPHQVCFLRQDCGLPYIANEPCGLQLHELHSWQKFKDFSDALPQCKTGAAAGQWVLPCGECRRKETCYWSEVVWQPITCTHRSLSRERLRECLADKQILSIGDSTLRGMIHYLIEQTNGSLAERDKTHDMKSYANVNHNRTSVSFAYYPQFWRRPINDRASPFDESLLRLTNRSSLPNDRNTVLVVGGVHWLSTQHLNRISSILRKTNLSKIRVIVKSLGAGFHLQVDGLHHLTLEEQRRLELRNRVLISEAESLGFDVVDTFSMTMARYKDFLEGKCACHFHKVKEVLPSFASYLRGSTGRNRAKLADMKIQFHIVGDINAVYSEILLSQICEGRG